MRFDVSGDMKAISRDLNLVERKIQRQAAAAALNRTASTVRTASVREIAALKNIVPQRLVRVRLLLGRQQRAHQNKLVAHIIALLAPIKMIGLSGVRETAAGVASRGRVVVGAFIARSQHGRRGVFKRVPGAKRLPIEEQTVPMQPEAETIIDKHIDTTGAVAWIKNFNAEMKWRLRRQRR